MAIASRLESILYSPARGSATGHPRLYTHACLLLRCAVAATPEDDASMPASGSFTRRLTIYLEPDDGLNGRRASAVTHITRECSMLFLLICALAWRAV